MTHDKAQEAAQRLQENVQYAKDAVQGAKETYQQTVETGAQNISGGDEIVMQLVDTAIASGILERIGAEYGATGAAVVAVLVGLYWTWRKKSGEIQNEIQEQKDEEEGKVLSTEESKEEEVKEKEVLSTPEEEVEKLKSIEEQTLENEGGIARNGEHK